MPSKVVAFSWKLLHDLHSYCKTKYAGLTEYTIDVRKNEVSVKGDFMARCDFQSKSFRSRALKSSTDQPKSLFACLTQFDKHKCNKK